ncbi:MAG TPA: DUF2723 domain-containing protein [Chloroflexia bacterium]|nr:DUF2723 domain-containing protein [Chloroflexia bacterium]
MESLSSKGRAIGPIFSKAQLPALMGRPERWLGPALSVGALLLYTRTLAPSLGGTVDSPEFQQAAYSMAVAHPTGYPLYLLLGRLWIAIFPFGDVAFRMNLLSAIFAALAVWALYALVRRITSNTIAGIAAAALFSVQSIPWSQASVAEINTFNTLLVGLTFLSFVLWADGRLPLPAAALAFGLAASHHRTVLLYVVPLALYAIFVVRSGGAPRIRRSHLALSVLLALLPFAAYAYLPLRAYTTPWYTNTWEGFLQHIAGESALSAIRSALSQSLIGRFRLLLAGQMFRGPEGWILLGLGLLGVAVMLFVLVRRRRARGRDVAAGKLGRLHLAPAILCAAASFLGIGFAAIYDIYDIYDYLAVPIFMWCVLVGVGFLGLLASIEAILSRVRAIHPFRNSKFKIQILGGAVVLLVAGVLCTITAAASLTRRDIMVDYSKLDRREHWAMLKQALGGVPPGTILIGDWSHLNEALYFQRVEGWRPDLIAAPLESVFVAEGALLDGWLGEGRQVYLFGHYGPIQHRFATEARGPLWQVTGRKIEVAVPEMAHRVDRRFGNSIVLIGYTIEPADKLKPGDLLKLTLFWQATERIYERYTVFTHVVDEAGVKVGQKDDEPQRGFEPTILWHPNQTVVDTVEVPIAADAQPGNYKLIVGMYNSVTQERLQAFGADGASLSDYPVLTEVTVAAP